MANRVRVRVEGLAELDAALGELPRATARNVLHRAGRAAMKQVEEAAKANVPVNSGALRDSITTSTKLANSNAKLRYAAAMFAKQGRDSALEAMRWEQRSGKGSGVEIYVGAGQMPHAHMIEFGTQRHGPQPYLRPAWDAHRDKVLESVSDALAVEIDKAAKRLARKQARLIAKAGG